MPFSKKYFQPKKNPGKPLVLALILMHSAYTHAELYFDPTMLSGDLSNVADLNAFIKVGHQLPGSYQVDIYINGNSFMSKAVQFITLPEEEKNTKNIRDNTGLMACLAPGDLQALEINLSKVPDLTEFTEGTCLSPGRYIPDAYTSFDFQKMRLDISIPQAFLTNRARGWIPPEQWDEGVNAVLIGYRLNGSQRQTHYGDTGNLYVNLNNGLNIGPWRLRDNRTLKSYSGASSNGSSWQRQNTYLERAIIPWRSQLTIGESATSNEVFDAFSFRGVQIATDDTMYPDTMRGFAPVVKGTAASNAQVSISQSGNEIFQTFVPPGAFTINDLYPLSAGGDLKVTVTEADGSTQTFTVPYSSVPVLQREGSARYSATVGSLHNNNDSYNNPDFFSATLLWGLPYNTTTYGGLQYAGHYQAAALGAGINLGSLGAFSADITHAHSQLADGNQQEGQSLRFQYARSLDTLGTTFQLTGYRYSTRGFYTLEESALKRMEGWLVVGSDVDADGRPSESSASDYYNLSNARRARVSANISQRLGDLGFLYLTGSRQTFWHVNKPTDSLQTGFSSRLGPVSYNVSFSYSQNGSQNRANKMGYLSLSVPLGKNATWANYSASRNNEGEIIHQAGLSGSLLEENNINWSLSQGYSRSEHSTGNGSLNYRGTYGGAQLGYSYGRDFRQYNYGLTGGAIIHSNGLTLGQQPGTTNVLAAAPGASNIPVENSSGVRTDWRGYALVPYSTAYRSNRISLNANALQEDTEIDTTTARVVPTRGALVRANFKTSTGKRAIYTLSFNGKPLPFGTIVTADRNSGIVGDDGEVYLSGLAQQGKLHASWGNKSGQQCTADYEIPEEREKAPVFQSRIDCR